MRLRTAVIPVIGLALFASVPASACSCARIAGGPCTGINQQSILFLGTVISAENPPTYRRDDQGGTAHYKFRVDEVFSGIDANAEVDVYSGRGGGDCSVKFEVGEQYLVNPSRGNNGTLLAYLCSGTRNASGAGAYINQLRIRKSGGVSASVFGTLRQEEQPYGSVSDSSRSRGLAGIRLQLSDSMNGYEATTDPDGSFAFAAVRPGKYTVTAELPPGLELGQTILDDPLPPVEVKAGSCEEHTLEAVPVGSITGHVVDKVGRLMPYAAVGIYRADRPSEKAEGGLQVWFESQSEDHKDNPKEFQFHHVAPGDYILVANFNGWTDAREPFERTFYPGTTKREEAKIVRVRQGESVTGIEIVVDEKPTRDVVVRVNGVDFSEEKYVFLKTMEGKFLSGYQTLAPGVFRVRLFPDQQFTIVAETSCEVNDQFGHMRSNSAHISGAEGTPAEVSLAFDGHSTCELTRPQVQRQD